MLAYGDCLSRVAVASALCVQRFRQDLEDELGERRSALPLRRARDAQEQLDMAVAVRGTSPPLVPPA